MTFPGTFVALFLIRFQHLARHTSGGFVNLDGHLEIWWFCWKKTIELERDVDKWNCLDRLHAFKPIFCQGFPQILLEKVRFAEENAQPRLEISFPSHRTASSPLSHGHRVRKNAVNPVFWDEAIIFNYSSHDLSIPKIPKIPSNWIWTGDIPTINPTHKLPSGTRQKISHVISFTVKPPSKRAIFDYHLWLPKRMSHQPEHENH